MSSWQVLSSRNSGLPTDRVTAIAEDASGALWFGTYGGGLARLDAGGRTWTVWRSRPGGLVNDYVGALAVDGTGCVWAVCDARQVGDVVQDGGICVLSPDGSWRVHPRPAGENCIVCLEADRQGALWLRTGGLYVGERLTQCDGSREGTERFNSCRWQAFDGHAWVGYEGDRAALAAWWPRRPARTRLGWELVGEAAWFLETVRHEMQAMQGLGSLFGGAGPSLPSLGMIPGMGSFLCEYNLVAYDGCEFHTLAALPSPYRFGELAVDVRGHAWVSLIMLGDMVMSSGVGCWDGVQWTQFNRSTGLLWDSVVSLSADSSGNVWCAHMLGDLSRWNGSSWEHLPGGEGGRPKEDLGRAVEDGLRRIWFPSRAGAVVYTP
jgi:hypothetical protein